MTVQQSPPESSPFPLRRRPAVGPGLRRLLVAVFGLFALLAVNAVYLGGVTFLEWVTGWTLQGWLYLVMFLVHLILGFLFIFPLLIFGLLHMRNTYDRPRRRTVYAGFGLFGAALLLLASGIVLVRIEGIIEVKDPAIRAIAYWTHVATPLVASWLFILHRLVGRKIRWRVGLRWSMVALAFLGIMLGLQIRDPRRWGMDEPTAGTAEFSPSLARTSSGGFLPERALMNDAYCKECHQDSHETWSRSVHRFASFNNPAYLFSVRETRRKAMARDGDVRAARFCAGCHDPVVLFSGKFDDPDFDDINDPTGQAGITCTVCHSITSIDSVRGNSDFTLEEPIHYPFAFSENPELAWVNRQLVKAKPEFHKRTFLKPLHKTTEFCGSCHKVHLPEELNGYKWLRAQNHYDSFLLSGVSGHGVSSFYYPEQAEANCNGCHMQLQASDQFSAQDFDGSGKLQIHDHQFPSANTAIPHLLDLPAASIERHREFNEGVMRVDIFGLRAGGGIDDPLLAPLRPHLPALQVGKQYLLETVVRTMKMGHHFTQGTADSNQIWLDVKVTSGGRIVGRSGGMDRQQQVDPWSHFVNAYALDREGNRIDRRNAADIFVSLYDHQIPPGAADTLHYLLDLPEWVREPVTVEVKLLFRKFDTTYMRYVFGDEFENDLPIMILAEDRVTLPIAADGPATAEAPPIPPWQRWNDYGIGLLRKGGKSQGQLNQAEEAFLQVEALGRPEGPINLARVYLAQGTVQDRAVEALERAALFQPPAPPWTIAWFTGQVNKQNGFLDEAIADFRSIDNLDTAETRERGFDFSLDYRLLNELGQTLFERAKQERGERCREQRESFLSAARDTFLRVLDLDPENVTAHFNLDLILKQLGEAEQAAEHLALYRRYKPDDNARERAITRHRAANPAADHAAEAVVIYDLHRPGAFGLADPLSSSSQTRATSGTATGSP